MLPNGRHGFEVGTAGIFGCHSWSEAERIRLLGALGAAVGGVIRRIVRAICIWRRPSARWLRFPQTLRHKLKGLCRLVRHKGVALAVSLAQAAEAIGRNRSMILRSIRRGTISAMRDQRTQAWMADPAELFPVFPPVPALSDTQAA